MSICRYVFYFFALFVCFELAAEGAGIKYTLSALIEHALARSDQILSQKSRIEERQEAASQASVWDNPSIVAGTGAKWESQGVGPIFQIGLSQPFFFPGKQRLREQIIDFDKDIEEIRLNEAELAITADVIRLAYTYVMSQRKMKFAQTRSERFKLIRAYLAGHTFASPNQKTTSLIVQERLRNISTDVERLQGSLNSILQQLNFYIDQDWHSPTIAVPWFKGRRGLEENIWIERLLSANTELAGQRVFVSQARKEQDLSLKEFLPDFSLSVFYNQESANDTQRIVGLSLNLPLPILNQNRAGIKSKGHKIKAQQHELMFKEKKIASLMRKSLAEYQASQEIVQKYPEATITDLEASLHAMEKEFRKNRIDFLLFLELDVQAAETVNRVLDAQLALAENISSLFFLSGDKSLVTELSTF